MVWVVGFGGGCVRVVAKGDAVRGDKTNGSYTGGYDENEQFGRGCNIVRGNLNGKN